MADPNWLLSAMAQSTAAIVAIIGGFILTKVISVFIEKNGILASISETENKIQINAAKISGIEENVRSKMIEYSKHIISGMFDLSTDLPDMDELIEHYEREYQHDIKGTDFEEQFQTAYQELQKELPLAKDLIDGLVTHQIRENPLDFHDFYNANRKQLEGINSNILRTMYVRKIGISEPFQPFSAAPLYAIKEREANSLLTIESLKGEIFLLQSSQENLKKNLEKLILPTDLREGFFVLLFLSLGGLIYPLVLMPVQKYNSWAHKWVPLIIFLIGFSFVIRFILFQIKGLLRNR